jgi:SpoIID/LytB domain protein
MEAKTNFMKQLIRHSLSVFVLSCSFLIIKAPFLESVKAQGDLILNVGIVQRFGEDPTDQITVSGTQGDQLTIKFTGGDNQPQTIETNQVTLAIANRDLEQTVIEERIILSDEGTFETAEDSANKWQKLGIEVEITQPDRWQVWAKRNVYKTPLLRRWLIQSLKQQGYDEPYLETKVLKQKPIPYIIVNGYRYNRDYFKITTSKNVVQVKAKDPRTNKYENYVYGGDLRIQPNAYGNFTLINEVPLESYLRGVVPYEIGPRAPLKAMEAQTIIARTYALRNVRRFRADEYQLCATTHCQVYKGLSGAVSSADQAITATSGLVLTYNNELVDALYSSTTGGITAPFSDIWNGEERPYLQAVIDSPQSVWNMQNQSLDNEENFRRFISLKQGFNEVDRSPLFRWNKTSNLTDLTRDFQNYLKRTKNPISNINRIEKLQITQRSTSGRILQLQVTTDQGVINLYKNEIRNAFSTPISTLFYLEPIYSNNNITGYNFIGGGYGHGVGLSQYGSYTLANLGWSAPQILAFYYPGTTIEKLNPSIVFWREN